MLGVELVTDRQLKTPAKAETLHLMDQMKGFFFFFFNTQFF